MVVRSGEQWGGVREWGKGVSVRVAVEILGLGEGWGKGGG